MLHFAETAHFAVASRRQRAPSGDVRVTMPDGGILMPRGAYGQTLAEVLIGFGVPLRNERGGLGGAAECHVRIAAGWIARLPLPEAAEHLALSQIASAGPASRLASQIIMTPALDGLEIEVDAQSLASHAWVAG